MILRSLLFYLVNPGGRIEPPCPPKPGGRVLPPMLGGENDGGRTGGRGIGRGGGGGIGHAKGR